MTSGSASSASAIESRSGARRSPGRVPTDKCPADGRIESDVTTALRCRVRSRPGTVAQCSGYTSEGDLDRHRSACCGGVRVRPRITLALAHTSGHTFEHAHPPPPRKRKPPGRRHAAGARPGYGFTSFSCAFSATPTRPAKSMAPWPKTASGSSPTSTTPRLTSLKEMGFTHLWLTGVLQQATGTDYSAVGKPADDPDLLKGLAGSPYAVKDYFDVSPDYAQDPAKRLDEFAALLARIHRHGMKALIDFIPNHVARSYRSTRASRVRFRFERRQERVLPPRQQFLLSPTRRPRAGTDPAAQAADL